MAKASKGPIADGSTLSLCLEYIKQGQCRGTCGRLHICRKYILADKCSYTGELCRFTHNITTDHNNTVLQRYSQFKDKDNNAETIITLRKWLQEHRNPFTVPHECEHYTGPTACRSTNCYRLHICKYYLKKICRNTQSECKRSHDIFNHKNKNILEEFGFPVSDAKETLALLRKGYSQVSQGPRFEKGNGSRRNSLPPPLHSHPKRAVLPPWHSLKQPMICMDDLSGKCSSKACRDFHERRKLPYCWQHKAPSDSSWGFFPVDAGDTLENHYCSNLYVDYCAITVKIRRGDDKLTTGTVRFFNMMLEVPGSPSRMVRRLSTPSTTLHPNNPHATKWRWSKIQVGRPPVDFDVVMTNNIEEMYWKGERDYEKRIGIKVYKLDLHNLKGTENERNRFSQYEIYKRPVRELSTTSRKSYERETSNKLAKTRRPSKETEVIPVIDISKSESKTERSSRTSQKNISICTDFLEDKCGSERNCPRYHSKEPYQWRFKYQGTWTSFTKTDNQAIEEEFLLVDNEKATFRADGSYIQSSASTILVSFIEMSVKLVGSISTPKCDVQRLSTPSNALPSSSSTYCTEWIWYQRQHGSKNWSCVDQQTVTTSAKLEEKMSKGMGLIELVRDDQEYEINFKAMTLKNISKSIDYDLTRRPTRNSNRAIQDDSLCSEFLRKKCTAGRNCKHIHSTRPFLWQHQKENQTWVSYDDNNNWEIEKAYCDVDTDDICIDLDRRDQSNKIDFSLMRMQDSIDSGDTSASVRRVCVKEEEGDTDTSLMTAWKWYRSSTPTAILKIWRHVSVDTDQETIPEKLLKKKYAEFEKDAAKSSITVYKADGQCQEMHLQTMEQTDENGKVEATYRRRPELNPYDASAKSELDGLEEEICVDFLSSTCQKDRECNKFHSVKKYQWFYESADDCAWTRFPSDDNNQIELAYCNPENDQCIIDLPSCKTIALNESYTLSFETMTAKQSQGRELHIKRLSTPSSGTASAGGGSMHHCTTWLWYWKDDYAKWQKYEGQIDSEKLEQRYQLKPGHVYRFQRENHQYRIKFGKMTQKNISYKTERSLKRRPQMESGEQASSNSNISLPEHWGTGTALKLEKEYSVRQVTSSSEWLEVRSRFMQTMRTTVPSSINRVENRDLWESYQRMKQKMEANAGKPPKELLLFHGTEEMYADVICKQGFDWRIAGSRVGTMYGNGSYFARDASYSNNYKRAGHGTGKLFAVRVLVGDYASGNSSLVRPPPRDPGKPLENFYDSCVDDVTDPSIYVIFNTHQAYPAYIVEYDDD